MKRFIALLFVALLPAAWSQTAPKSTASSSSSAPAKATSTAAPAAKSATPATTAKSATSTATVEPWIKLPPNVPRVVHLPVKMPFALRYEDIKVGTGAEGEPAKLWHLKYTGWRAADGVKFDSWDEHAQPEMKDGKPQMGPDNKPIMKAPEPLQIPQGVGRVIPGFDFGLEGMKIGGKRRIFIPWQMAYGTHAIPDRPDHPGIPAKSDLIFDVELVDVTDMPAPMRPGMPGAHPAPGGAQPHPGASGQPGAAPGAPAASGAGSAPAPKPETPATQPATPPPATAPSQPATAPPPQSTTPPPQK